MQMSSDELRDRLAFAVSRLAQAADRLQDVDFELYSLKVRLEKRALELAEEGNAVGSEQDYSSNRLRLAQSHAIAQLARKAVLTELVRSKRKAIPMMAASAISRWIGSLRTLSARPVGSRRVRLFVESGRVACRVLRSVRRGRGLQEGVSLLGSALVVAEFVHPDDYQYVETAIDEGLKRALFSRRIHSTEQAIETCSLLLRESAHILEQIAARAEPAVDDLLERSATVEDEVQSELSESISAHK